LGQVIALFTAKDECVEIYYASEMKAGMCALRVARADNDF
jgi:hypothetical protein